ncbi:general transcriptional repressor [Cryptococcus neoformans A2-102-5]|nr:general transcriptional repressor [Cryptococcus neoformans var. grubii D17-1]OXG91664.1 general transcriptional repressor [Cryptococcus neoformans var. grubii A2-102-5]
MQPLWQSPTSAYPSIFTRRPLVRNTRKMPESRMSHPPHPHSHHHHSAHHHSSHPHSYQHPPPPNYPSSHPSYSHHHHTSRHVSNGHSSQVPVSGPPPPQMPIAGPPADSVGPSAIAASNAGSTRSRSVPPMSNEARAAKEKMDSILAQLAAANENTWMLIGAVAEGMNDQDRALSAFENALRHNPSSVLGLNAVASIARGRDDFDKAIEYFQRILNANPENGEVWGSMGHCLLMKDDLPKAYTSYQQALYHLANPKEPKLWYGIGILYDRYGSFEHAEEAFSSVLKVDPNFEKANEIYFRLGIIYKHQRKYKSSLDCFRYILNNPPRPLTSWDIWFQLGHVYEQDRDFEAARDAYMRVLSHQPDHAKVLQQLGWLYHQPGAHFADQEKAVSYLTKSLETDPSDAQSWYLLGRAYMAAQRYNKAYEAYQQAVYRDGRNPTFWCSIGVLYYQIAQYRDALDAYSRAIRLNPYISEVWYNLGSLYESCNNQMADAMDAYSRALELDPNNTVIKQRMALLQNPTGGPLPPVPPPIDVHPSQYTATPTAQPPAGSPNASPSHQLPSDAPAGGRDLPPPPPGGDIARGHSPGPFRNGAAPPPLNHVDEPRGPVPGMTQLARMESEPRPAELRDERYNGRYDPADIRRHNGSPLSPRASRRESQAFPSQPSYFPPKGAYARDREREEWDRSRGESRAPQEHSPRVGGRTPGADPRIPQEYRDYPGYYDPRAAYPPPLGGPPTPSAMAGRFDPRREAEEFRHREEDREVNGAKQASLMRQENRMPSPAPSIASSKNGRKRGEGTRKAKDKEEKAQNKKEGGRKGKAAGLKAGEEISGQSPRGNAKSPSVSVHNTPQLNTTRPIPPSAPAPVPLMSRTVDEDYDEGAADALMVLAGDRSTTTLPLPVRHTTPTPSGPISPPAPTPNAGPATGAKRPGPEANSPEQANKRVKAEKSQSPVGSASGSASSRAPKRMVIEVLNTPSIASPLPRTSSVVNEEKQSRASQERREERREEATSGMEIDERAARISTPLPPPAPLSPPNRLAPSSSAHTPQSPPRQASSPPREAEKEASRPPTPPLPDAPPSPAAPATAVPLESSRDSDPRTPPLPPPQTFESSSVKAPTSAGDRGDAAMADAEMER